MESTNQEADQKNTELAWQLYQFELKYNTDIADKDVLLENVKNWNETLRKEQEERKGELEQLKVVNLSLEGQLKIHRIKLEEATAKLENADKNTGGLDREVSSLRKQDSKLE